MQIYTSLIIYNGGGGVSCNDLCILSHVPVTAQVCVLMNVCVGELVSPCVVLRTMGAPSSWRRPHKPLEKTVVCEDLFVICPAAASVAQYHRAPTSSQMSDLW